MCEHKNLKTVNDQLFCKDCGQNLPMDFLTGTVESEPENLEAEEILEDKLSEELAEQEEKLAEALAEQGDNSEAPQEKQEDGQNPVVSDQTGESAPVKKERKTARKTAKKGE